MRYLYGPVPSRRLGRSLGVNVTPLKTCTFNCVYCQLGRTTYITLERQDFFPKDEIINEIKNVIDKKPSGSEIDYITFAGEGEPTLCNSLGEYIDYVKKICKIPVAVLTNSSLLFRPEVRIDLLKADLIMPSLDAGTEAVFKKMNRPIKGLTLEKLVKGVEVFRKEYNGIIWLEVMLISGINDSRHELTAINEHVQRIKPDKIFLNVPIRPPAEVWVEPPPKESIKLAREIFGEVVPIITEEIGDFSIEEFNNPIEAILYLIRRHPMHKEQVIDVLRKFNGIDVNEKLYQLLESGKVKAVNYKGKVFMIGVDDKDGGGG